jgi:hypothetical protein
MRYLLLPAAVSLATSTPVRLLLQKFVFHNRNYFVLCRDVCLLRVEYARVQAAEVWAIF